MNRKNIRLLLIVFASVLIIGVGVWLYNVNQKSAKPIIVFKESIIYKQNQLSFVDETPTTDLPVIDVYDIIDLDRSQFDEVSFNLVPCENKPMDMMFRFVDTSSVGDNFTGVVYASYKNNCGVFEYNYSVVE